MANKIIQSLLTFLRLIWQSCAMPYRPCEHSFKLCSNCCGASKTNSVYPTANAAARAPAVFPSTSQPTNAPIRPSTRSPI